MNIVIIDDMFPGITIKEIKHIVTKHCEAMFREECKPLFYTCTEPIDSFEKAMTLFTGLSKRISSPYYILCSEISMATALSTEFPVVFVKFPYIAMEIVNGIMEKATFYYGDFVPEDTTVILTPFSDNEPIVTTGDDGFAEFAKGLSVH